MPKLGLSDLSTYGVALGSDTSPPDWQSYVGLDRHELAHAAIDQSRPPEPILPMSFTSRHSGAEIRLPHSPGTPWRSVRRTQRSICVYSGPILVPP